MDNVGDGIVLFVNSKVGFQVTKWLLDRGEDLRLVVVHPLEKGKYGGEIHEVCKKHSIEMIIWDKRKLEEKEKKIAKTGASFGISIFFGYILRSSTINLFSKGIINLHPALLPYNKGAYPNVWAIVDGTPAGVTIHFIDEGVDTGDIIFQLEVDVEFLDTGESLYRKLEKSMLDLFVEKWEDIKAEKFERRPQPKGGTLHKVKDIQEIDSINPDKQYPARKLIDILRARTFPGYDSAYIMVDGKKYFIRLNITDAK